MMLQELKDRLTSQSLVASGYTVYRDVLPDTPDKAIALYETGGSGASIAFGGDVVEHPTIQIVVRGAPDDRQTPLQAIQKIYQGILAWGAFVQGTTRYVDVTPIQAPYLFDRDDAKRVKFAFNCTVEKGLTALS